MSLVQVTNLSFTYPGAECPALDGVSFSADAGELVLVMGASGAGKTTFARCLNRAIPSYQPGALSGAVWIDGADRSAATVADLSGIVGLVTQDFEAQLFSTNVLLEVAFGMEQLGVDRDEMRTRVYEALELVGLDGFEGRDPSTLSGGEKQRLSIAAVLAMRPVLVVFDEPTTDLDPRGKREIFEVLAAMRQRGMAVILVEHEVEAARYADRLVLMQAGRVVEDEAPGNLSRRVSRLQELGVPTSDLDRLAEALGHRDRFDSVQEAARELSARGFDGDGVADPVTPAGDVVVSVRSVDFAYPGGPRVLNGVSLDVRSAERTALIGPNGSGKTTLSKHFNGLLAPSAGKVWLGERDLRQLDLEDVATDVGYVFQNPDHQIFAASVLEEVRFAVENLGLPQSEIDDRTAAAIAAVSLEGFEDADPFGLGKGHRQRLAVASLLVLRPRLLILDEPTTGLDVTEQREMMDLLRRLQSSGTSVLVITHTPWVVAEWSERCIVMEDGTVIFDGATRAFLASDELMRRADFEPPDATRVGRELGVATRSVDELTAGLPGAA